MTDKQIEILRRTITGLHGYDDVDSEGRSVLLFLSEQKYCCTKQLSDPVYWITQKGLAALQEIDDKAEQKSKDERQQRFENKVSVLSVLIPFVTFILGILVEHFSGVLGLIIALFHSAPPVS